MVCINPVFCRCEEINCPGVPYICRSIGETTDLKALHQLRRSLILDWNMFAHLRQYYTSSYLAGFQFLALCTNYATRPNLKTKISRFGRKIEIRMRPIYSTFSPFRYSLTMPYNALFSVLYLDSTNKISSPKSCLYSSPIPATFPAH